MNDNVKVFPSKHVAKQGVDHLPGQLDLIDHAMQGAPQSVPEEKLVFEELPENVVKLGGETSLDIPVNRILQAAHESELETVIVLGYKKGGGEYFAASVADAAENMWMLERAKYKLLRIMDERCAEHEEDLPTDA